MKRFSIVMLAALSLLAACNDSPQTNNEPSGEPTVNDAPACELQSARVLFYNVENLFDLEDNPEKDDDWFLPTADTKWDEERYDKKLSDLTKAMMGALDGSQPLMIGLCEIENRKVVEDLKDRYELNQFDLDIVHEESLDNRGIDVALLYNTQYMEVVSHDIIRSDFAFETETYTSRDILYVEGKTCTGEVLHIFVNHWPSRRDGLEASEPRRTHVAGNLRKKVDEVLAADMNANIIIMGDFNDEPTNKSINEVLMAKGTTDGLQDGELFNMMAKMDGEGQGSYNYRGNWDMLDQFIVSENVVEHFTPSDEGFTYRDDWMIYHSDEYGDTPNRTYGGPNYYGGVSDHLPIWFELEFK